MSTNMRLFEQIKYTLLYILVHTYTYTRARARVIIDLKIVEKKWSDFDIDIIDTRICQFKRYGPCLKFAAINSAAVAHH